MDLQTRLLLRFFSWSYFAWLFCQSTLYLQNLSFSYSSHSHWYGLMFISSGCSTSTRYYFHLSLQVDRVVVHMPCTSSPIYYVLPSSSCTRSLLYQDRHLVKWFFSTVLICSSSDDSLSLPRTSSLCLGAVCGRCQVKPQLIQASSVDQRFDSSFSSNKDINHMFYEMGVTAFSDPKPISNITASVFHSSLFYKSTSPDLFLLNWMPIPLISTIWLSLVDMQRKKFEIEMSYSMERLQVLLNVNLWLLPLLTIIRILRMYSISFQRQLHVYRRWLNVVFYLSVFVSPIRLLWVVIFILMCKNSMLLSPKDISILLNTIFKAWGSSFNLLWVQMKKMLSCINK